MFKVIYKNNLLIFNVFVIFTPFYIFSFIYIKNKMNKK